MSSNDGTSILTKRGESVTHEVRIIIIRASVVGLVVLNIGYSELTDFSHCFTYPATVTMPLIDSYVSPTGACPT
jgi:hypothetical protein